MHCVYSVNFVKEDFGELNDPNTRSTIFLAIEDPIPKPNPSFTDCPKVGCWILRGSATGLLGEVYTTGLFLTEESDLGISNSTSFFSLRITPITVRIWRLLHSQV